MARTICEDAPCCGCCGPNGDDAEQWREPEYDAETYNFGDYPGDYEPYDDDDEEEE